MRTPTKLLSLLLFVLPLMAVQCQPPLTTEAVFRSRLFVEGSLPDAQWNPRRDAYLGYATEVLAPSSVMNLAAHLQRMALEPGYQIPAGTVTASTWDALFTKIDSLRDTSDFDVIRFLWLWYAHGGHSAIDPAAFARVEQMLLDFKYWFTDPTPAGKKDDMWYWTENHQIMFHVAEYLAGQAFPDRVFSVTGWTGAQHVARADAMIREWMDYRSRYGFSEFHSHVYYEEDLFPLLAFVEFANDRALATRAATLVDLLFFDIARHQFRGSFAGAHGRTYKKDKTNAHRQDTFTATRLLFDTAELPFDSRAGTVALMLCGSTRYRIPAVLTEVARFNGTTVDRERMGIRFDENEPIVPGVVPVHPDGIPYDGPSAIVPWWGASNHTAWQLIPLTLSTMQQYGLWDGELFQDYAVLRPFATTGSYTLVQGLALGLAPTINMALLSEVNTQSYRTADFQLMTAQSYRPGMRSSQAHAWTAVLPGDALVFTTHPGRLPKQTLDWNEDDDAGFWTGSASLPRSAQHENVAIHLYSPAYYETDDFGLGGFTRMLDFTHAFFPQERFDEVVQDGNWTFGRKGDSYLGLWSWRPAHFEPTPPGVATDGLVQPFELRAPGGPDDVWIVELGSASQWGSFAAFRAAVAAARIDVARTTAGQHPLSPQPAFDVAYESPSQGTIEFGWGAPLRVRGTEVPISGYARHDDRWAQTPFGSPETAIFDAPSGTGLYLDTQRGVRLPVRRR